MEVLLRRTENLSISEKVFVIWHYVNVNDLLLIILNHLTWDASSNSLAGFDFNDLKCSE